MVITFARLNQRRHTLKKAALLFPVPSIPQRQAGCGHASPEFFRPMET